MFADKEFIQKRAEMMKNGVSWSDIAKLQSDYDRRAREQERMNILRKSQERKEEMDYYYQLKMKRVQSERDEDKSLMELKNKEQDDLENTSRSQWMDIKNKVDYRLNLAEKLGSRISEYRNESKDMPPAPDNMTIIYESDEYKQRRVRESIEYQRRLKNQMISREEMNDRKKREKLEEETQYLRALERQKGFEEEEMMRRRTDLDRNQKFLKKQIGERKVREDGEDRLTKEEIAYNRYMFVPSRPPYL